MKDHNKTLIGGIITFIIGTSCCWISSLAVWLGGTVVIGAVASFIESSQSYFILASFLLAMASILLYFKNRKTRST